MKRPDPDDLLARIRAEEQQPVRGKLKIFLGATAGVGKTYSMLDAARLRRDEGVDVIVGIVETHKRKETEGLLEGLEILPRRQLEYRGTVQSEFNIDAALLRRPQLILIDELAHTNVPGSRHTKRWQDVEELLNAGINVYTTVNIQHLESLSDIVKQITDITIHERIPDALFEQADEIEMVDLSPEDLLKRLQEGKVYIPQQAELAMRRFFRKGNLMALRELALRHTADRVDEQMESYRQDHAITQTWPAGERIMVSVSPSPLSRRLIRAAKRMANGLHADWIAVYVETPSRTTMPEEDRQRVVQTLRLAERLGAKTVTLTGERVSEELLAYAQQHNVSKIIVGKPVHPRWRDILFGSVLNEMIRGSGKIDVYVISGDPDDSHTLPSPILLQRSSDWRNYAWAVLVIMICTAIARLMFQHFEPANLIMVYLVGIVIVATRIGRGPSILASILSVALFDFFFVQPHLTFAVGDSEYLVTFAVMLMVSLVLSTLTNRIKRQAEAARERERHTASLYAMSRELANSRGMDNLIRIATQHIGEIFDARVVVLVANRTGHLEISLDENEQAVAEWVYEHGQIAGQGTDTLPGSHGIYLPLKGSQNSIGVIGLYPNDAQRLQAPDQRYLLETFVGQTALALERARLSEEAERVRLQVETEQLRNSLLSSVSHDLRTPLASITGAASGLLEDDGSLDIQARHELAQLAYEEAERLNRMVGNLLDMTRLEAGVRIEKEWQPLEEVIGIALNRLESRLSNHPLTTSLPPDLPLIPFDSLLIEQVFVNLLENAIKYTPPDTPIELSAQIEPAGVLVEVADRGPGLSPGIEQLVFDKFYRAQPDSIRGAGLGLAICQSIIKAHGGRIWAENRPGGGAVFRFVLPIDGQPPEVKTDG
ncbi:MAG TPA: sensor histidine kinase KdpD [Aggregatilineaceae bacterium]|nr:sensor histidine kinase KdpD [Aggregatilineaceae bacterium]